MFKQARLKLTFWYVLIISVILWVFSVCAFTGTMNLTENALRFQQTRIERRMGVLGNPYLSQRFQEDAIQETLSEIRIRVITILFLINIVVLVITASLSYWLSGITLNPIQQMMEKQKRFTADASHELKTPLTAIKTDLEVSLRDKSLSLEQAKETLERLIQDVDSMTALTNRLLKVSHYGTYDITQSLENVDIKKVVEKVLDKFGSRIQTKQIQTTFEGPQIITLGNNDLFEELFSILIDNAIKFTNQEGKIDILISSEGSFVVIDISDTGVGIPEKDLHKIFDRFYKSDLSRTRNAESGFGLGLSIAKEIVTSLKGTISVQSILNRGTNFKIKLPLRKL